MNVSALISSVVAFLLSGCFKPPPSLIRDNNERWSQNTPECGHCLRVLLPDGAFNFSLLINSLEIWDCYLMWSTTHHTVSSGHWKITIYYIYYHTGRRTIFCIFSLSWWWQYIIFLDFLIVLNVMSKKLSVI